MDTEKYSRDVDVIGYSSRRRGYLPKEEVTKLIDYIRKNETDVTKSDETEILSDIFAEASFNLYERPEYISRHVSELAPLLERLFVDEKVNSLDSIVMLDTPYNRMLAYMLREAISYLQKSSSESKEGTSLPVYFFPVSGSSPEKEQVLCENYLSQRMETLNGKGILFFDATMGGVLTQGGEDNIYSERQLKVRNVILDSLKSLKLENTDLTSACLVYLSGSEKDDSIIYGREDEFYRSRAEIEEEFFLTAFEYENGKLPKKRELLKHEVLSFYKWLMEKIGLMSAAIALHNNKEVDQEFIEGLKYIEEAKKICDKIDPTLLSSFRRQAGSWPRVWPPDIYVKFYGDGVFDVDASIEKLEGDEDFHDAVTETIERNERDDRKKDKKKETVAISGLPQGMTHMRKLYETGLVFFAHEGNSIHSYPTELGMLVLQLSENRDEGFNDIYKIGGVWFKKSELPKNINIKGFTSMP